MKKIFAVIAIVPLSVSLFMGSANAQENGVVPKYDVAKNVNELSAQLVEIDNSNLTGEAKKEEALDVIVQAPEEVQLGYFQEVKEDMENYFKDNDVTIDEAKVVELDNAVSIAFDGNEHIDTTSATDSDRAIELASTKFGYHLSDGFSGQKAYGDRKATYTVTVKSAGLSLGKMVLGMHYSIGDYGLKMRYSSKAGTKSLEPVMVIKSSTHRVTDSKAEKNGYDMDAIGEYTWTLGLGGVGITFNSDIKGKVQLVVHMKKDKKAHVRQSYTFVE